MRLLIDIKKILTKKALTIFATINYSGNANIVGLKLNKSVVLISGNPKAGIRK